MQPFILFEGLDHTGKSTIAKKLAEKLDVELLHSPPKEMFPFRKYFDSLDNETNLIYYVVCNHILNFKIAKIIKNKPVILDRYFFTTIAYHSAKTGKNLDKILKGMTTIPTRIYYFTGEINELENRTKTTGLVNNRFHGRELWEKVDKNYKRLFKGNPTVLVIDTTNKSIQEVFKLVYNDFKQFLQN